MNTLINDNLLNESGEIMKNIKFASTLIMALLTFFVLQTQANSFSANKKADEKPSVTHSSSSLKCSGDKAKKVDKSDKKGVKVAKCGDGNCKESNCKDGKCKDGKCGGDKSAKTEKSTKKTEKSEKCGAGKCA